MPQGLVLATQVGVQLGRTCALVPLRRKVLMYWRYIPHRDPDEFAGPGLGPKQDSTDNRPLAVMADIAKYLAITAAIYLLLAIILSAI